MADLPENPNNREEEYLADIAGLPNDAPENPWSRKEAYLAAIGGRLDGIDAKIAALATDISLKGSVADYDHLPTDAAIGDAYITEDTGILYVWVGDEWTPLNMQGGGGVKELTTADYNYPANSPTSIAIWLLDEGYYKAAAGVSVSRDSSHVMNAGTVFIIGHPNNVNNKSFLLIDEARIRCGDINNRGNVTALSMTEDTGYVLDSGNVIDSVTSSTAQYGTHRPLSAKQGYVLNNKIGDLSTLQTTAKTNVVSAINEVASGGSEPIFYLSPSEFSMFSSGTVRGVHIYSDSALDTVVTAGGLQAALFDTGKATFVVSDVSVDTVTKEYFHIISCTVPDALGLSVGSGMWIRCGICGFNSKTFSFGTDDADPDKTTFDITVE